MRQFCDTLAALGFDAEGDVSLARCGRTFSAGREASRHDSCPSLETPSVAAGCWDRSGGPRRRLFMKSNQTASVGRPPRLPDGSGSDPASSELEARCRHQAREIDTLGEAVSAFERGARALKAEHAGLRAENDRLRRYRSRPDGRVDGGEPAEAAIPIGVRAPGVA